MPMVRPEPIPAVVKLIDSNEKQPYNKRVVFHE